MSKSVELIPLKDYIEFLENEITDAKVRVNQLNDLLSSFKCKKDASLSEFLVRNAVVFEKRHIARTYLVVNNVAHDFALLGYYTILLKVFYIDESVTLTNSKLKSLGTFSNDPKREYPAFLIGQLAKSDAFNVLERGEILEYVLSDLKLLHSKIGGKVIYLECIDNPVLIKYYNEFGFDVLLDNEGEKVFNNEFVVMLYNIRLMNNC